MADADLLEPLTFVRAAEPAVPPPMISVRILINGPGRVFTDDGLVDCTATCTVQVPQGTRLRTRIEPAAGHIGGSSTCPFLDAYTVEGWCEQDVTPDAIDGMAELVFLFRPGP